MYKVSHLSYHTNKHHANVDIGKFTNPMDPTRMGFQVMNILLPKHFPKLTDWKWPRGFSTKIKVDTSIILTPLYCDVIPSNQSITRDRIYPGPPTSQYQPSSVWITKISRTSGHVMPIRTLGHMKKSSLQKKQGVWQSYLKPLPTKRKVTYWIIKALRPSENAGGNSYPSWWKLAWCGCSE